MKIHLRVILLAALVVPITLPAQQGSLKSGVYTMEASKEIKAPPDRQLQLLKGSTTMLADLEIVFTGLKAGQKSAPQSYVDSEVMIIVELGSKLKINVGSQSKTVGEGSVALAVAGDKFSLENTGQAEVAYFVLKFKPKVKPSPAIKQKSQGSFIVDWETTTFKPHERGGRRDIFDRGTNLFERFEMHVTTLKEGVSSHDPHKHNAEEIILLIRGGGEMLIAGEPVQMDSWDVVFLDSQVLHGITEGGVGEREYYAFQWEVTK